MDYRKSEAQEEVKKQFDSLDILGGEYFMVG